MHIKPIVIIIVGPTASGKTALSYDLARVLPAEIINADMGQFYTPLSVGTAKPDWQKEACPAYLFDIVDEPRDMTVKEYRQKVLSHIDIIVQKNKTPIVVGGSLFYIKSLLYPPQELLIDQDALVSKDEENSWEFLNSIDPVRAAKIHPNDTYRIQRALAIWRSSGKLPSSYEPKMELPFQPIVVALMPPLEVLRNRIKERAVQMVCDGDWLKEVSCLDDAWRLFLQQKKIIGYDIMLALHDGDISSKDALDAIYIKTCQYAKRQQTFLKKFIQDVVNDALQEGIHIQTCVLVEYATALQDLLSLLEKSTVSDKLQYEKQ